MTSSHRMVHWVLLFLLLDLSAQGAGCSAQKPHYSAEHMRFERIYDAVQSLQRAYVKKDLSAIRTLAPSLDSMGLLEQQFKKDFETYQDISLDLSIERIVIEGETIDVFVHWRGQWTKTGTHESTKDTGLGKLRWAGKESILLLGMEGDLPFGIAMRQ